jgi:SOS-response transcriptional repressor LexA
MPRMVSDLAQRIRERLDELRKSPRAASLEAGKSADLLRGILSGRNKSLNAETAARLADVLGVSVEWLMTGQGNIAPPSTTPAYGRLRVPLISWVSAGVMSFPDISEEILDWVEEAGLDPDGDWIALRVVGDSMDRISPPESIIFIDRKDQVLVPNACYVISNGDGEATYKRFRSNPMRFEPVSTNPAHEPIYPTREPLIIGRVKKSVLAM